MDTYIEKANEDVKFICINNSGVHLENKLTHFP